MSTSTDVWIDEFLNLFNNFQFEKANLLKHENMPERIFRYRPINEHSIDNLRNDTIWLSSADKYNDPYDSAVTVDFESIYKIAINKALKENPPSTPEVLEKIKSIFLGEDSTKAEYSSLEIKVKEAREHHKQQLDKSIQENFFPMRKAFKVCSFSLINSSIIMWAHYAKNHEGFCVEYNLKPLDISDECKRFLFPVIYSDKICDITNIVELVLASDLGKINVSVLKTPDGKSFPISLGPQTHVIVPVLNDLIASVSNGQAPTINPTNAQALFDGVKKYGWGLDNLLAPLYKSREWSYEREWRFVQQGDPSAPDQNCPMPTPSRIYLGAKISQKNKESICDIAASKKIDIFQMKLSAYEFKLFEEKIS